MRDDGRADPVAGSGHDVEHAGRKAGARAERLLEDRGGEAACQLDQCSPRRRLVRSRSDDERRPCRLLQEGRERVGAAVANSGFSFPLKRITVNLAPADVRKEGSAFDLPIALGVLAAIVIGALAGLVNGFFVTIVGIPALGVTIGFRGGVLHIICHGFGKATLFFCAGAIAYATEFVTERLKLDWDRLWVTVHAGDPELKLGPDQVAIDLWEKIGMPAERIVPLPSSENFWSVGGPGPCGPDSEIYYDWGEEAGCGAPDCKPGCTRCERFLEFWNLVFMSYELHPDGTLTPLPEQNIDTGLGLERTARIVQQVASVYDTDGYQLIMRWIEEQSGVAYGETDDATKAHRVLADHGRGMTFIAAEGVSPSNEGRGYVLRRIVRRAVQHGLRIGMSSPFLPGLADVVKREVRRAGVPRRHVHAERFAL